MEPTTVWQNCLSLIRGRVAAQTFQTWFEPLQVADLTDTKLVVQVPSQFYYEWLDAHYRPIILDSLKQASGVDLQIGYKVSNAMAETEESTGPVPTEKVENNGFSKATRLNHRYTFENFVEGAGNQFAKAAALSVSVQNGASQFNPLVLYGGVGLGKTHLLQAIGNQMLALAPDARIIYATSEKFTLDFITSIQRNRTDAFSRYYRSVDMLLVDDIQFFQKKEQTQEQFFHTFNDLFQRGKQIVMTLDRPPAELSGLTDRLISRFQSGLIVDIQPPDLETRIAILLRKAEQEALDIPFEITEYIAQCIKSNVRDLEGALIKLLAYSSLKKEEITINLARMVVQQILGRNAAAAVTVDEIIRTVAADFDLREVHLVGKGRKQELAHARQVAMYLARELTGVSLVAIGLHFAGRDHTTVIHACKTVAAKAEKDPALRAHLEMLTKELANPVF